MTNPAFTSFGNIVIRHFACESVRWKLFIVMPQGISLGHSSCKVLRLSRRCFLSNLCRLTTIRSIYNEPGTRSFGRC